jgi:hypothetical protein
MRYVDEKSVIEAADAGRVFTVDAVPDRIEQRLSMRPTH